VNFSRAHALSYHVWVIVEVNVVSSILCLEKEKKGGKGEGLFLSSGAVSVPYGDL
jgi:hypothetical protein